MEDIQFINETYDIFEKYGCDNKEKIENDLLLLDAWLMEIIFNKLRSRLDIPRIKFSWEGKRVKYEGRSYDYDDCDYIVKYELEIEEEDLFRRYNALGESKVKFIFNRLFELKNPGLIFSKEYEWSKYGDFWIRSLNPFRRKCMDKNPVKRIILLLQEFWRKKWEKVKYLNLELIDINRDLIHSLDLEKFVDTLDPGLKANFIYSDEARERNEHLYQVLEKLRELGIVFVVNDTERFICERFKGGGARNLDWKHVRIYIFLNKEVQFGDSSFESYSRS